MTGGLIVVWVHMTELTEKVKVTELHRLYPGSVSLLVFTNPFLL